MKIVKILLMAAMVAGLSACAKSKSKSNGGQASGGAGAPVTSPTPPTGDAPVTDPSQPVAGPDIGSTDVAEGELRGIVAGLQTLSADQREALTESNNEANRAITIITILTDVSLSPDADLAKAAQEVLDNTACEVIRVPNPDTTRDEVVEVSGQGCPLQYRVTVMEQTQTVQKYKVELAILDDHLRETAKTRFARAELTNSQIQTSDTTATISSFGSLELADGSTAKVSSAGTIELASDRATLKTVSVVDTKSAARSLEFRSGFEKEEIYTQSGLDPSSSYRVNNEDVAANEYSMLSLFGI